MRTIWLIVINQLSTLRVGHWEPLWGTSRWKDTLCLRKQFKRLENLPSLRAQGTYRVWETMKYRQLVTCCLYNRLWAQSHPDLPSLTNWKLSKRDGVMGIEGHNGQLRFKKYGTHMNTKNEQRTANTGHLGDQELGNNGWHRITGKPRASRDKIRYITT